jgi:hypothetical protein
MQLDLTRYSYTGEWFEFRPGVRLKIRPYPQSMSSMTILAGAITFPGADALKTFDYCLVDAEGLDISINGEAQALTAAVKKVIFDFDVEGIPAFVIIHARDLAVRRDDGSKNSEASPGG